MPNIIRTIHSFKRSPRRKSFDIFRKVINLRKNHHSYSEIRRETGIAKSTIQNWLTYAGLTLTKEHLEIQLEKQIQKKAVATEASKITKRIRRELSIQETIESHKKYFSDPFFNYGLALFQAEGSKSVSCKFSNSDFKLILVFINFLEKYFSLNRIKNISFDLYIHKVRRKDLERIKNFWSKKIQIPNNLIKTYWKRNTITGRKTNSNYVGQMQIRIRGEKILGSKLLALSAIILSKYQRS